MDDESDLWYMTLHDYRYIVHDDDICQKQQQAYFKKIPFETFKSYLRVKEHKIEVW